MHYSWYLEHKAKRVNKIIEIFGHDWFNGKSILELGACHGDIGIEFIGLGARVVFADARLENLKEIESKIPNADIRIIDQNSSYDLKEKFDLVLHLGTLWHLEFWYNDLYHALKHSDQMILETRVLPIKKNISVFQQREVDRYTGTTTNVPVITQYDVEKRLQELNCTYHRYDDFSMNLDYDLGKMKMIYDWTDHTHYSQDNKSIHHRRFWHVKSNRLFSSVG